MTSSDTNDVDMSSVGFTIGDAHEDLIDIKQQRISEVRRLMTVINNNEAQTLRPDITPAEIREKRLKFMQSMQKFISQEQPKDLPIPDTPDFYEETLKDLENEVRKMQELEKVTDEEIAEIEADISYMEQKKSAFDLMKQASLNAAESEVCENFEAEMKLVKSKFKDAKGDLQLVVETLFPENVDFYNFLTELTRAYNKGGDDLYIDVNSDNLDIVTYLEEADIIRFHPSNKNQVRLCDL